MKTLCYSIIGVGVIMLVVFVPVMPLEHSTPFSVNPNSFFWPDFFGSVTWDIFQCGMSVGGTGTFEFNCIPMFRF